MSKELTAVQVWETLNTAGLATPEECRKWARGVAEAVGKNVVADPKQLIATLVRFGYLTPYQGNVVLNSLPHPLKLENLRVMRSMDAELGRGWYEAIVPSSANSAPATPTQETQGKIGSANKGDTFWVAALSSSALGEESFLQWPPSMSWAEKHAELTDPHLDSWGAPGATLLFLFMPASPWSGRTLESCLDEGPLTATECLEMVRDLARAVDALHRAELVHGRLHPSSIVQQAHGGWMLRRDPWFPPCSPYRGATPSFLPAASQGLETAAPELALQLSLPTVRSDLYALGCVWYRCLSGAWPFAPGENAASDLWARVHSLVPVQPLDALTETEQRCLMHLLAKDPRNRFSSAGALLRALDASPAAKQPAASTPTVDEKSSSRTTRVQPSNDASSDSTTKSEATPKVASNQVREPEAAYIKDKPSKHKQPQGAREGTARSTESSARTPDGTGNGGESGQRASKAAEKTTLASASPTKPTNPDATRKPDTTQTPKDSSNKPTSTKGAPASSGAKPEPSSSDKESAEKLAAEIRDKKSKLALRYHNRPFGTQVPGNISALPIADAGTSTAPTNKTEAESPGSLSETSPSSAATSGSALSENPSVGAATKLANSQRTDAKPAEAKPDTKPTATAQPSSVGNENAADSAQRMEQKVAPKLSASSIPDTKAGVAKPALRETKSVGKAKKGTKKGTVAKEPAKKGKGKKKRPVWIMPALIAASFLVLGTLVIVLQGQSKGVVTIDASKNRPAKVDKRPSTKPESTATTDATNAIAKNPIEELYEIKSDDGKILWAPPTAGTPYALDLIPMGAEALVFISGKSWSQQPPVANIVTWWKSLNPDMGVLTLSFDGIQMVSVQEVAFAWFPGETPNTYKQIARITFRDEKPIAERLVAFNEWTAKQTKAGSDGFRGTVWVRDQSTSDDFGVVIDQMDGSKDKPVRRLTIGPVPLLESMAELRGGPYILRRQLDVLMKTTDERADLTVVVAPSFLYGDAKEMFGAASPRILAAMRTLVGDAVQGLLIRTHFEPTWYLEWRTLGNDIQAAPRHASELKSRLETLSDGLETGFVQKPADPYWRAIAMRYPQMLRAAARYTRAGAEDGQVVANAYLPTESALNLVIGSWMSLQRDVATVANSKTTPKPPPASKSIDEWLSSPIKLRIEQDSLENVLQAIATEIKDTSGAATEPIPMAINGTAFQKDGITRNQQIRNFTFDGVPLKELLTTLAKRANPVTTVKTTNEKDQKVVWVVLEDPNSPTKKKIELTTRAWADSNSATMPAEFVIPKE